jgi:cytosine/adenosine deaminase-related metal-dependent hydrolase
MLSKGCTACFDLVYEFPRPTVEGFAAVARAYADAGMRAVLAPMVADKNLFTAIPGLLESLPADLRERMSRLNLGSGEATIAAIEEIASERNNLPAGIQLAIAPTIPHHCSERFLLNCAQLAERYHLPIHMHIAESRLQVITAQALYGMSPVQYLAKLGLLRPGFVAAHAIWLDDADLDLLAEHQCAVAHIPASNFRLGSGVAHVRPMLDRGITVGLATDGANSSDALCMLQAMRLASCSSRAYAGSRDIWLSAQETVRLATQGGADLLGLPHGGRIEEGAPADLTFFDLGSIDFIPLTDPINQVVTCASSASVSHVMACGRFVVREGRAVSISIPDLHERAAAAQTRIFANTANERAICAQLEPHAVAFAEAACRGHSSVQRLIPGEQAFGNLGG